MLFNVQRLSLHGHLCDAGKIYQCQVHYVLRVDHKRDRLVCDVFLSTSELRRLIVNLLSNLFEVGKNFVLFVGEDGVLISWVLLTISIRVLNPLQIEDEGAASHDTIATGQEVSPDDALQDRTFPAGLRAHHDYLRKLDRVASFNHRECILQLDNEGHQGFNAIAVNPRVV